MKNWPRELAVLSLWMLLILFLVVGGLDVFHWEYWAILVVVVTISTTSYSDGLNSGIRIGKIHGPK